MTTPTPTQWTNFGKTALGILLALAGVVEILWPDSKAAMATIVHPIIESVIAFGVPIDPAWTPDAVTLIVMGVAASGLGILDKLRKWMRGHPTFAGMIQKTLGKRFPVIALLLADPAPVAALNPPQDTAGIPAGQGEATGISKPKGIYGKTED